MKNKTLLRITKYIGQNKGLLIGSILCAIIGVVSSLIGPMFIGKAIDNMVGPGEVKFQSVFNILTILAIVYGCSSLFTWLLTYFTNRISYKTVNIMRHDLFNKVNTLPLKFYDRTSHGDIISRFVNDIDSIADGMLQGIATLLTGIVTIIGSIGFMLWINPIMTMVVVLSAPFTFIVARFITTRSQQLFREQAKKLGSLNGYVEEMITGQKTIKAFNYEARSFHKFKSINDELYRAGVKSQFYGSLANPSTRLVNNITYSIIGIIGSVIAIMGKITIGDISSFLIYSNLFSKPFNEITGVFTQIQGAIASAERIFIILDMDSETLEENLKELKQVNGNIKFNHVKFSYTPEKELITNLSFNIKPGSKIAIVGKTGAGKTTLVNLLMRFYEVNGGSILIDDKNIKDVTRDSLRQSFGMVLQDTFLFSDTIGNNIAYGKSDATKEEIIEAAKAADAHSFIRRLPNGYDTIISGSGDNLSQGQKQLLTIARVMLVNPPMLILDEATSNIDTRTELRIQNAFQKVMEGRTSFIIAHRLSTIKEADMILVMEEGDIIEQGTHKDLLKANGPYAKLYNSQFPLAQ